TQKKATMSTHIFRVILDQLPSFNHISDLRNQNHPVWSRHLPDSMREIDDPFCSTLLNRTYDI
ncbi:MAG: hypothetical protein JZU65_17140, partial [Chlorobium sp.]|nr:hypothetical protein [Chlorobium sp.]